MNPVKFIIISLSLLFSHAAWAGDSDPVWIRRELARSWVKSGKIIIYDPGKENDRFPWIAI